MVLLAATHAMGTRFEAVLDGPEEGSLRAAAEAAMEEIEDQDRRWSAFRRESLLSRINERAGEGPVRLDEEAFELLLACREVHLASEGAFDPTVAPLLRAHGFRGPERGSSVEEARARVGMDAVRLDPQARTVRFLRPGTSLDLGAIGKGEALDLAAARLRAAGVGRALLHGGTSGLVAIGAPPGLEGWRIALRGGEAEAPALVAILRDRALSVSAPHGRTVEREGRRLGHVLDPRTGEPSSRARAAAAIGRSARAADAWTTALLVLGARPRGAPEDLTSAILGAGGWRVEGPEAWRFEAAEG